MRAVRYHEQGAPDVLGVDEVDEPTAGDGQVVARVEAASVNGIDLLFRGEDDQLVPPRLPWVPGSDFAGVVEAVGRGVREFEVGDRVAAAELGIFLPGTYAEYVAVPTDWVARVPDGVSSEEAAALGHVGLSTWHGLIDRAGLEPAETLLVHGGSGGVGHVAVQLGAVAGADVIATSSSAERRDWISEHGATHVLDYRSDGFRDALDAAAPARGIDVILDGHLDRYLELDLEVVAQHGRIVSLEFSDHHGTAQFSGRHTRMGNKKDAGIQFVGSMNTPDIGDTLERLLRLVDRGRIEVVVEDTYGLEEAAQAHRDYEQERYVGKLLLIP